MIEFNNKKKRLVNLPYSLVFSSRNKKCSLVFRAEFTGEAFSQAECIFEQWGFPLVKTFKPEQLQTLFLLSHSAFQQLPLTLSSFLVFTEKTIRDG